MRPERVAWDDDLSLLPPGVEIDHAALRAQIERPTIGELWGARTRFTPVLIDEVNGDGRRLVFVEPIFHRPRFIVARVDSSVVELGDAVDEHGRDLIECILDACEDQYGRCACAECDRDDRDKEDQDDECLGFPADVDWGGGWSWGGYSWPQRSAAAAAWRRYRRRHLLPNGAVRRLGGLLLGCLP